MNSRIEVFGSSGVFQSYIGTPEGSGNGELRAPAGVAVSGSSGDVYVSDSGNSRVQIFSPSGSFLSTFGSGGSGNGQFASSSGLTVGPTDNVYVADTGNNRVEVFNSNNSLVTSFGSAGSGNGQFSGPFDVAVAPTGDLYVADQQNGRIERWFDASSWVSGNNTFTDPSLGPTTVTVGSSSSILGSSLTLNPGMGLTATELDVSTNGGTPLAVAGGSLTTDTLVVGTGAVVQCNGGSCSVGLATLSPGSELTMSSGSISGTSITLDAATFNYQGGAHNIESLIFIGGSLMAGQYTVNANENVTLGVIDPATVTCSILTVAAGGTIDLDSGSTISAPVLNIAGTFNYGSGTMATTTNVEEGGMLNVLGSLANNGVLDVQTGGLVAGSSSITNSAAAQITGAGIVASAVSNSGLIEPIGLLNFTGAVTNNGTIAVAELSEALFSNFPSNGGTINLSGGTLSSSGQPISNNATIEGFGMLLTGGLTNNAMLALTGSSSVSGPVINAASGTIHLSGSSPNTFLGAMTNSGVLTIDAGANGTIDGAYTGSGPIIDNGSLYLISNSMAGPISGNGNLTIGSTSSGPAVVALNVSSGLSTLSSLSLLANSTLNITNNHLIIDYAGQTDPIASIAALIESGYAGGTWNGSGIDSSVAAANSGSYGIGYADSADTGNPAGLLAGTIEIKYTLLGDANLDGTVNGVDFGILAANFNKGVSRWDQGDFNYDNVVNGVDFGELAANFNKGASGASALSDPAIVAFAEANGLMADLPEPASVGISGLTAVGLLLRRQRRADRRGRADGEC